MTRQSLWSLCGTVFVVTFSSPAWAQDGASAEQGPKAEPGASAEQGPVDPNDVDSNNNAEPGTDAREPSTEAVRDEPAVPPAEQAKPQAAWPVAPMVTAPEPDLALGARVYKSNCASCHGNDGDGNGAVARYLTPRPRDFTKGLFKFRSTAMGQPPTSDDLARTVGFGIPGTAMPPFADRLSEAQIDAVVAKVQSFSDRFDGDAGVVMTYTAPADLGADVAQRGSGLFAGMCGPCHGAAGQGDGAAGAALVDSWGDPVAPADLTRGVYKSGDGSADSLFRVISAGIEGTPMPPWGGLPEAQRWGLVAYVMSLPAADARRGLTANELGRIPQPSQENP